LIRNAGVRARSNSTFQDGTHLGDHMASKFLSFGLAVAAASTFAMPATAQVTLPANVQADRGLIQQDQIAVQDAFQQLRTDEAAGNASAAAADRTALRLAHMKMAQDFAQLHQDAQPLLQPGQAALTAALTQLLADQRAGDTGAVQADQAAVASAEAQLKSNREAIFEGLGKGFGGPHGHRHG